MKTKHKIIFSLVLIGLSASINAADFAINENTKVSEIRNVLGTPIRSLTKENKQADFSAPDKYTFFDLYTKTFGISVIGVHPSSFKLSKKLDTKSNANLLKIQPTNPNLSNLSILGIELGMSFKEAKKKMANTTISSPEKSGKIEYTLSNGEKLKLISSGQKVTDVELFLN